MLALPPAPPRGECVPVPWCESCDRFYNPRSVAPDGTCMKCGRFIAEDDPDDDQRGKAPWHFWLLVAALVAYLGWRLVQTVIWAFTGNWPG